jgi:hypothetical protein
MFPDKNHKKGQDLQNKTKVSIGKEKNPNFLSFFSTKSFSMKFHSKTQKKLLIQKTKMIFPNNLFKNMLKQKKKHKNVLPEK